MAAVVFHEGDAFDTAKYQGGPLYADLRLVDLSKNQVSALSSANGYDSSGAFYLPYGKAEEEHLDYEPSVLPVPVGGYYWMLFTSRRCYGNTIAPGGTPARGGDNGASRKAPKSSHRARVRRSGSHRSTSITGASSIPVTRPSTCPGKSSNPAICAHSRRSSRVAPMAGAAPRLPNVATASAAKRAATPTVRCLQCVPPPDNSCSNEDEACATGADCCDSQDLCINKRCATPAPVLPPVH